MGAVRSAEALSRGALWVATAKALGGRGLVEMATSEDEDAATIATMFLSRGGEKSVELVREHLTNGGAATIGLIDVFARLGGEGVRGELESLADSRDDGVAARAERALDALA